MLGTRLSNLVVPLLIVMFLGGLIGAAMWSANGYDHRGPQARAKSHRAGRRRY